MVEELLAARHWTHLWDRATLGGEVRPGHCPAYPLRCPGARRTSMARCSMCWCKADATGMRPGGSCASCSHVGKQV